MSGFRSALLGAVGLITAAAGEVPSGAPAPGTLVRVGDHPGFSRVVFDLPPDAAANVVVEGQRVLLVFKGVGGVASPSGLPRNLRAIQTGADTATLDMVPGSKARPIRIGERLVIDVLDAPGTTRTARPGPAPAPGRIPAGKAAIPPAPPAEIPAAPTPQTTTVPPLPDAPAPVREAAAAPVVPVAREALPEAAKTAATFEPPPPADPAPPAQKTGTFLIKADTDVGAAAFRRGGFGLVVLDRALPEQKLPGGVVWTRGAVSTVVQVPLPPQSGLRLVRSGPGWTVEVVPELAVAPVPQTPREDGVGFSMARPGRSVAVLDPVSGGVLLVGTSLADEGGVAQPRRTPDYRLLASWLGVPVEPSSDQVDLRSGSPGFVLAGSIPQPVTSTVFSRRFDLPPEPAAGLVNRLQSQLASAANAAPRARTRDRLAAVQTMIALGMGAEAQALAQQVTADDPQAAVDAQTGALTAVAAVLAGRPSEAGPLDDPRLDGTDEVTLWRGLRDRALGRDTAAAQSLGRLAEMAQAYPATLQRLVWPDVAESAVSSGRILAVDRLSPFAAAMQLQREGKLEEALAAFDRVAAGPDRRNQVRATVQATELRLAAGRLTPQAAAAIMERQAYAWRGDGKEAGFRLRGAALRAAAGEWRPALDALRAIEADYPDQKVAVMTLKTTAMDAMLTAEGAGLSALDVVLLAAEYADCVPDGEAGSAMARLLAEKLTALDLPARTIPVLQGLVRGTQAGEARAEFGVRLGELLLEGGDAAGARTALEASAAGSLSASLTERRALLMARCRAALGESEGAVAGLVALGTAAADDLRASLKAAAGDWAGSLVALDALAAKRVPAEGALNDAAQDVLVRQADAAVRARDAAALRTLRLSAARLSGTRADVFRLLTAQALGNPADLVRARTELAEAQQLPKRLQAAGLR